MSKRSAPVSRYFLSSAGIRSEIEGAETEPQVVAPEVRLGGEAPAAGKSGGNALRIAAVILCAMVLTPIAVRAQGARPVGQPAPVKKELERGYGLIRANKRAEAIQAFSAVLRDDPTNKAATIELAYLNSGLKRWPSAIKFFRSATEQDPQNPQLHMDLGYAYQAVKDYGSASKEFETVASSPGEFQTQAQSALKMAKDMQEGARAAADAKTGKALQAAYAALKAGKNQQARRGFEAVLKENPNNAQAAKQLGYMDLQAGDLEAAAKRFETARAAEASDYFVALQLGYVYEHLGERAKAAEAFNAALASTDEKIHSAAAAALGPNVPAATPAGAPARPIQ